MPIASIEDWGSTLSAAPVGICGVQILSLRTALLYYRNVTSRSHIDIRQFETHAWLVVWPRQFLGPGSDLLTLVNGRGVLPVRPRLFNSCDLPFCLRIEFPAKALPVQHLGLLHRISVCCMKRFCLAMLPGRFWPPSGECSGNQDVYS